MRSYSFSVFFCPNGMTGDAMNRRTPPGYGGSHCPWFHASSTRGDYERLRRCDICSAPYRWFRLGAQPGARIVQRLRRLDICSCTIPLVSKWALMAGILPPGLSYIWIVRCAGATLWVQSQKCQQGHRFCTVPLVSCCALNQGPGLCNALGGVFTGAGPWQTRIPRLRRCATSGSIWRCGSLRRCVCTGANSMQSQIQRRRRYTIPAEG